MLAYIKGILAEVNMDNVVVECGGLGYSLAVSKSTALQLGQVGSQVQVYTFLHVREDAISLFGFASTEELEFFKLLLGVNGVGPKVALGILGAMSLSDLRYAILSEDAKAIAKAPGIGAKTAQRVILDLRDKVGDVAPAGLSGLTAADPLAQLKEDVMDAMSALGYGPSQVLRALEDFELEEGDKPEDVIKALLRRM